MSKPTNNPHQPSATAERNRYFNQYANGIGYLNSIREFGADGKPSRYAVQVSVIQGPADNVHYESHDLVIASKTVLAKVVEYQQAIESEDTKVLIHFNMINPRAQPFMYKKGDRAGELGSVISGFLSRILSLKIDGELVYKDQRTFDDQEGASQAVNG